MLARFFRIKKSASRATHRRNFFWHNSFNFLAPHIDLERPIAEQDVDIIRAAGLFKKNKAPAYKLDISTYDKKNIKKWLEVNGISLNEKLVVIHAASRWKFKEIPVKAWSVIVDQLKTKNINVVISGAEHDFFTNTLIYDACNSKPVLTKNFSLRNTASLFAVADLVLTIDSMSTHLASAIKTPVISIFGPTNEKNWGPWQGKYKIFALSDKDNIEFGCRPCRKDGCDGSKISQCLVQIEPMQVVREVLNMLR